MTPFERQIPSLLCGALLTLVILVAGWDNPLALASLMLGLGIGWLTPMVPVLAIPSAGFFVIAGVAALLPHWL